VARRESSDSASAAHGGDLEEWTRGAMDPAFDSAAFALPPKTISPPVLSQFGFHLIEITSRKGNKAKGRHILIPIELAGAHRDKLDAEADSLERLAADRADPASLDTVSRVLKLRIGKSGPVQEGTKVQLGQLVIPDAGVWAFQSKRGATSPVIETPIAFYVFRLDSLLPEGVPPLKEIHETVEQVARTDKKQVLGKKLAEEYLKRVESGSTLAQAAQAMKLPNKEFGPFPRVNPPLTDPVVVGTSFGLEAGKRSGVLDTKQGMYVLQVLAHTKADSADFVKELDKFRGQMIQTARQDRVRNYLAALREAAKVVDNRKKVLRNQPAGQPT
jgi:peptidyl-prolyl cis-trans isomerase D